MWDKDYLRRAHIAMWMAFSISGAPVCARAFEGLPIRPIVKYNINRM